MRAAGRVFFLLLMLIPATAGECAIRFDGNSGQVQVPGLRIRGESPLTIEFIATPQMPLEGWGRVISNTSYLNGHRRGLAVGVSGGYWTVYVETGRGWRRMQSDHPAVHGARIHFAAVFERDRVTMFVNGKKNDSSLKLTHRIDVSDQDFLLGCERSEGGDLSRRFIGDLEAIRISSIGRYERNFEPPARLEPAPKTLLLYDFEEHPGKTCRDLSGYGNDGVVSGLTWNAPEPGQTYPNIDDLQKSIGKYEVQRKIKGGGTLTNLYFQLTPDFKVSESGKHVGRWRIAGRNELEIVLDNDQLGPVNVSRKNSWHFTGVQKKDGRAVEWSLQRLHIVMLWHHKRTKGKTTVNEKDFALFSNGRFGSYDHHAWTWERRDNRLIYHWSRNSYDWMTLSRDGQSYVGKTSSGDTLKGVRLD